MFPCTSLERPSFTFCPMKKGHVLGKKYHLSRLYRQDHVPALPFLERPSFQKVWRKYHISMYFLKKITFIFCLRCKIIFSGKGNIIFPDNIGNIMFQRNFFGKTIFSGRSKKKKMVFRAAYSKNCLWYLIETSSKYHEFCALN